MTSGLGIKSILNKILTPGNCAAVPDGETDVQSTAKDLAYCVVDHYTNGLTSTVAANRRVPGCSRTLLRVVDHMSERHNILFNSIVRRLEVDRDNIATAFRNVVDEMFADSQFNWGRIVTVYAFAGWLARHCCCGGTTTGSSAAAASLAPVVNGNPTGAQSDPELAVMIAECAGSYVAQRLSGWVWKQGGWDVMNQFFADRDDPEGALWHGLLYTFVGLGALAAMAAVR